MNQIVNINLGGYPFTIDQDAYQRLSNYLDRIRAHFKNSEGCEEITSDIEARLAELFRELLDQRVIVADADVQSAIDIMGTPEEFGAESESFTDDPQTNTTQRSKSGFGKKLFRDQENAVLGGVAAGLSAYFGVDNPLWARIFFVLLTIGGGLSVIVYPILWIALPPARNAGERLAMRGEKIDINSIGSTIEEDLRRFGSRMNQQFGDGEKIERLGQSFGKRVEHVVLGVGRGLSRAFRPGSVFRNLLRFVLIVLLVAAALFWIATTLAIVFGYDMLGYLFVDQPTGMSFGISGTLLLALVPLMTLGILFLRTTRTSRLKTGWLLLPLGLLLAGGVLLGISVGNLANDFKQEGSLTETVEAFVPTNESPLLVEIDEANIYRDGEWDFKEWEVGENEIAITRSRLEIKQSADSLARIKVVRSAQGRNIARAERLASTIEYPVRRTGNRLLIPAYFPIPEGTAFRAQSARVILEAPNGMKLRFSPRASTNVRRYSSALAKDLDGHRRHGYGIPAEQVLLMTTDGLTNPGEEVLSELE